MGNIVAPVASVVVGGALALATIMGFVSSQTGAPDRSPGNAEAPEFSYGVTAE